MLSKDKNYINNALELIGNTPLIKLNKITEKLEGSFFAKYEASNPTDESDVFFLNLSKLI